MSAIYEKGSLILRIHVGEAATDDGKKVYELTTTPGGSMLVKSKKTGRTFDVGWQTAVEMAVAAGIDKAPRATKSSEADGKGIAP